MTNHPTDLFINGAWARGSGEKRIAVINPSDGTVLDHVADADVGDAIAAVDAAAAALPAWAKTPARQRSEILRRCYELMMRDSEDLARLISLENGKALRDARGEVAYAAEFFRWFAEEAVRINGDLSAAPSGTNRILVQYQPIGVSLLITPWNFPAAMATRKIAPALAAGCTCVLKPATETPLTAYAVAKLLAEAGVPDGVVNVITSSKTSAVVNAMLEDINVEIAIKKETMQKTFAKNITNFQGYMDQVSAIQSDVGSRMTKLDMIRTRVTEQYSTFKDLKSENEDVSTEEAALNFKEANVVYEAALAATSNLVRASLIDYL